jgi:hypothetical protein
MRLYQERYGATNFDFYDLTAIVKRSWIIEFTQMILDKKLQFTWQLPSGTRSEAIDGEVSRLLYESGCRNMSYAPESGSPEVLKRIKKVVKLDRLEKSVRGRRQQQAEREAQHHHGLPERVAQRVASDVSFLFRMGLAGVHDMSISIFSPYPARSCTTTCGSPERFRELSDEYFLGLGAYKDFSAPVSFTEGLSPSELNAYRIIGFLVFYGTEYAVRPWRLVRLIQNLVQASPGVAPRQVAARPSPTASATNAPGGPPTARARLPDTDVTRQRSVLILAAIVAVGAAFRFLQPRVGAPYYHFHMDEHFVIGPADTLRRDVRAAAMGSEVLHVLAHDDVPHQCRQGHVRGADSAARSGCAEPSGDLHGLEPRDRRNLWHRDDPGDLRDRGARGGPRGGAACGLFSGVRACSTCAIRTLPPTDMPMVFFCMLTLWLSLRVAERGDWISLVSAGAAVGAAVASKYTGHLSLGAVGVAYLLSPDGRPD